MKNRKAELEIRIHEIKDLVHEILEKGFLQEKLGFPNGVKLKKDSLILAGHEIGALTAVTYAMKDPRVKACLTLDLWMYP